MISLIVGAEYMLMDNIVKFLSPITKATVFIQNRNSTIGVVIPIVVTLRKLLSNGDELRTIKDNFLAALDKRIEEGNIESNPNYFIATLLDPRFKLNYFDASCRDGHVSKLKKISEKLAASITESIEQTPEEIQPTDEDDFFSLVASSAISPPANPVEPSIKIKVLVLFELIANLIEFRFLPKWKSTWPKIMQSRLIRCHFGAPIQAN